MLVSTVQDAAKGYKPVCILTKQPYKLKAALSTRPATKKQTRSKMSPHRTSTSAVNRREMDDGGTDSFDPASGLSLESGMLADYSRLLDVKVAALVTPTSRTGKGDSKVKERKVLYLKADQPMVVLLKRMACSAAVGRSVGVTHVRNAGLSRRHLEERVKMASPRIPPLDARSLRVLDCQSRPSEQMVNDENWG